MKPRLLMSPPVDHGASDATRQWERLVELIRCAGDCQIEFVDAQTASSTLPSTAHAALVHERLVILADAPGARAKYRAWFAHNGFAVTTLAGAAFGGASDALYDRRRPLVYVGYGHRTDRDAALQLAALTGVRALPLELVDPRFAHLDTALCPLGSGHLLVHLPAFAPAAERLLRRTIAPEYLVEISAQDAAELACNLLEIGDAAILASASGRLRRRLHALGYRVFTTDLSAFSTGGASARRLTLRLDDGPCSNGAAA
ncbi:MAG: dimethylarginine dimethylaminohydrolase family protein [Vulcanimicrobiaceae bacterium]